MSARFRSSASPSPRPLPFARSLRRADRLDLFCTDWDQLDTLRAELDRRGLNSHIHAHHARALALASITTDTPTTRAA